MPRPINKDTPLGKARSIIGISAAKLAHKSGVGTSTIQQIEQGRHEISVDIAMKLAPHLKCKAVSLMPVNSRSAIEVELARASKLLEAFRWL